MGDHKFSSGLRSLLIVGLLLVPEISSAATYYVDAAGGNDGNSGTATTNAWRTISKVNSRAFAAGDSILLKCGSVWRETLIVSSSGAAGSPITLGSFGTCSTATRPVINGANLVTTWTRAATPANAWMASVATKPKMAWFDNARGIPVASVAAVVAARNWFWQAGTLYVFATANPATAYVAPGVEISVRAALIDITNKSYITIQDLRVTHANDHGITVGQSAANAPTAITIQRTALEENFGDGFFAWRTGTQTVHQLVIQDSTITQNGSMGIRFSSGAVDSVIRRNTINDNCWSTSTNYTGGIKISGTTTSGVIIESNEVGSNGSKLVNAGVRAVGIWLDTIGSSATNIIRYNKVHHNFKAGIMVENSANTQVYYNIVYAHTGAGDAARGIWVYRNASGVEVYNNSVYGNNHGIQLGGTNPSIPDAVDNVVINNISAGNVYEFHSMNLGPGNVIRNNMFGVESPKFLDWQLIDYDTYAAFDQGYGADSESIQVNPLFVVPGSDFHLKDISPAINAGVPLGFTRDYEGKAIVGLPDLGAIEFAGQPASSACDINGDGATNVVDTQRAINQALGIETCTNADINKDGRCDVVDVQRVVNAALGSACQTTP